MNIQASLKINQQELKRELEKEIKRVVYQSIPKVENELNQKLPAVLKKHLSSNVQPITGNDYYALGVPTINDDLQTIIDAASKSFKVKVTPANLLKIEIGVLEKTHAELLALPEAVFQYSSRSGSGILQWLKWILLEGNSPVVDGFEVNYTNSRYSRTGGALMQRGSFFRVPENLQGVAGDNILTTALIGIENELETLVKQVLNKRLG